MSGKYGLNSWVNNLKENWVEKLVGKLCKENVVKNWVEKLG